MNDENVFNRNGARNDYSLLVSKLYEEIENGNRNIIKDIKNPKVLLELTSKIYEEQ